MASVFENDIAVEDFLKAVNAQRTETKPRKFSWIYWVYLKYCVLNNISPLSRVPFAIALSKIAKGQFSKHRHETKYFIDCELFNLKYEDQIALKEYKKEEHQWVLQERKRKAKSKKLSKALKRSHRLKKEKERAIQDSKSDSSLESNKNTTTSTISTHSLPNSKNT